VSLVATYWSTSISLVIPTSWSNEAISMPSMTIAKRAGASGGGAAHAGRPVHAAVAARQSTATASRTAKVE